MKLFFLHINFEIQSTLKTLRHSIIQIGFVIVKTIYQPWKLKNPWKLEVGSLLQYPENSLGFHTGCFLLTNNFNLQPSCEDHDIYHVLTGAGIGSLDEIAMQYWLMGNGKLSFPTIATVCAGAIIYPDKLKGFYQSLKNGAATRPIHNLNHIILLGMPLEELNQQLNLKSIHFQNSTYEN
ncbi:MAG: Coq4 family protein [Nonlabens sp.]